MLKFYFLTYKKMANKTLSTIDTQKVQSILDWLTRSQKEILFDLLKKEKDQREEQERMKLKKEYQRVFPEIIIDNCKFDL